MAVVGQELIARDRDEATPGVAWSGFDPALRRSQVKRFGIDLRPAFDRDRVRQDRPEMPSHGFTLGHRPAHLRLPPGRHFRLAQQYPARHLVDAPFELARVHRAQAQLLGP